MLHSNQAGQFGTFAPHPATACAGIVPLVAGARALRAGVLVLTLTLTLASGATQAEQPRRSEVPAPATDLGTVPASGLHHRGELPSSGTAALYRFRVDRPCVLRLELRGDDGDLALALVNQAGWPMGRALGPRKVIRSLVTSGRYLVRVTQNAKRPATRFTLAIAMQGEGHPRPGGRAGTGEQSPPSAGATPDRARAMLIEPPPGSNAGASIHTGGGRVDQAAGGGQSGGSGASADAGAGHAAGGLGGFSGGGSSGAGATSDGSAAGGSDSPAAGDASTGDDARNDHRGGNGTHREDDRHNTVRRSDGELNGNANRSGVTHVSRDDTASDPDTDDQERASGGNTGVEIIHGGGGDLDGDGDGDGGGGDDDNSTDETAPVDDRAGRLSGPLHAFSWSHEPHDLEHITPMIEVRLRGRGYTSPEEIAARTRSRPPGRAVLLMRYWADSLLSHPDDAIAGVSRRVYERSPWSEHGIEWTRRRVRRFFQDVKAQGGQVDHVVMDFEKSLGWWSMGEDREQVLRAMFADPRFPELAAAIGFSDPARLLNRSHDSFVLSNQALRRVAGQPPTPYDRWRAAMARRVRGALEAAGVKPIKGSFPDAKVSNYGDTDVCPQHPTLDPDGVMRTNHQRVGDYSSPPVYGKISNLKLKRLPGGERFGDQPFRVLLWHVKTIRAIERSSSAPLTPWIHSVMGDKVVFSADRYYRELVYHVALADTAHILFFNPFNRRRHNNQQWAQSTIKLNELLESVNSIFKKHPSRDPLDEAPADWNSAVIWSGVRFEDGTRLYRITTAPEVKAVKLPAHGETLTFSDTRGRWYRTEATQPIQPQVVR